MTQYPSSSHPLQTESIQPSRYLSRTPEDYLQQLPPELRSSFSEEQVSAVRELLAAAIPKPAPKLVDLRFGVDLIASRFYVVLLVGKDRRRQRRSYLPEPMVRVGNGIAAVVLLLGLNLLISLIIFLLAYLVKSAVGIDLFPDSHLADHLS
ncbi:MAG: hypothetical protein MUF72_05930 [Elainella sp. Prado103]|jgi:hypothetical protein|nr:hypothetical protein [Elainella sp. Prado103]